MASRRPIEFAAGERTPMAVRWCSLPCADVARERDSWRAELEARRQPLRVAGESDRLVLLGTAGGANAKATRCGYANAVVVGDAVYVVDCGEGVHTQLFRAGLAASRRFGSDRPSVAVICVTHLHTDHIVDLINVLQGGWPSTAIDVFGPSAAGAPFIDDPVHPLRFPEAPAPGLRAVLDHLHRAFALNVNARRLGEGRCDYLDLLNVREIGLIGEVSEPDDIAVDVEVGRYAAIFEVPDMDPFVVRTADDHGVTITASFVQHAPVFPALAYRFDTPSGSVVFSGDTGPCDNVVRLARDADLLVHEVIDLDALSARFGKLPNGDRVRAQLGQSHTPVDRVGAIAARAGVRTLVLSHLVPGEGIHTPEGWEAMVRAAAPEFEGEVVCGVDLDEFALAR